MKTLSLFVALFLSISGCKKEPKDQKPHNPESVPQILVSLYQTNCQLNQQHRNKYGWIDNSCDAYLFQSLNDSVECMEPVDYTLAEEEPGKSVRRPLEEPCWTEEEGDIGAAAEWSRDMGVGKIYRAFRKGQLRELEDHAAYGEAHGWIMGRPREALERVLYTPQMIGLLYNAIYALGGEDSPHRLWPEFYPPGLTGYQAHLQVLQILLRGEIEQAIANRGLYANGQGPGTCSTSGNYSQKDGPNLGMMDISQTMLDRLKEHYEREPLNPLFATAYHLYFDGNFEEPIKLLMDEKHWPIGRLPSRAEHCEFWLVQRSYLESPSDWLPCGTIEEKHSYGDWLFVADLILRRVLDGS